MTSHPHTTVRVPNGELGPVIGYQARSAYDGECCVNWDDGSVWFLGRLDCGGIFAQRWYEPNDVDEEAFGPWRDCPGPELGVFARVDALEAANGSAATRRDLQPPLRPRGRQHRDRRREGLVGTALRPRGRASPRGRLSRRDLVAAMGRRSAPPIWDIDC